MIRNAASQPAALPMPPPTSRAAPTLQPPTADSPKPTVEWRAIVAPLYSGWALSDIPDVRAPESAGMAAAYATVSSSSRRPGTGGKGDAGRQHGGQRHEAHDSAMATEADRRLVAEYARGHGENGNEEADADWVEQGIAAV